jgi:Double zinc ribbon
MNCPQCGTDNRGDSNFCRFCGYNLTEGSAKPDSGYMPSVPPPAAEGFKEAYTPPENYQTPNAPPVYNPQPQPAVWGQLTCPRCGSTNVRKGGTPVWAIIVAVVLATFTCFLSLFLLLVKEPHRCLNCGNAFK